MDRSKLLGNIEELELRLSQVDDARIAPLLQFVRWLRIKMGPDAAIPFIDPWGGGIEAEVLFLL
jgi:hypothetical protein